VGPGLPLHAGNEKFPEPNKTIPVAGIPLQPLARKAGALLKNKTALHKD